MTDKNQDGLVAGQPVDFATLQRVEHERKTKPEVKEEPRRGRQAKAADSD